MSEAVRDYAKLAKEVIRLTGGKHNIASASRCATRLRLILKETPADAKEQIEAIPGVITVVEKAGQFQVVIGPHVGDVFEVVAKELNLNMGKQELKEEKQSLLNRVIGTMSAVFAPFIYILAASGLIQGCLIVVSYLVPSVTATGTYEVLNLISWTPFTFLPIFIAITASKHFHCNTYVAVACCLALVNGSWGDIAARITAGEDIRFLFLRLSETTYTSTVLPPLILVIGLAMLERFLQKRLPEVIEPIAAPFLCLMVMVPLTYGVIGPITQLISDGISIGYNSIYQVAPPVAAAIVGGLWQVIVIFGVHWGIVPIVLADFAQNGSDSIQVFITIAIVAQMAAAFGVFLKVRDRKVKNVALSAGITAIFGITEPAIYGVTLPRKKPFIYGCICAAAGSIVASLFGSMNYVYAGLPSILTTVNSISSSNPKSFAGCMAGCAVAVAGTILLIFFGDSGEKSPKKAAIPDGLVSGEKMDGELEASAVQVSEVIITSPLTGEIKGLSEVNDPTFSSGILGKGLAIVPSVGELYAPFDCEVASLFETNHAIGLKDSHGIELLLHIGLETVSLGGKYFTAHVKMGDQVKAGERLITFNLDEIKKGFDTITPVLISNADAFQGLAMEKTSGSVKAKEPVMRVKL